jgi:precorrin-6B methylase 2
MDWITRRLRGARRRFSDARWERHFGVDTTGLKPMPVADGHWYQPIPYRGIFRLLDALQLTAQDVMFEVGCGKGRVLLAATRTPVGKLVGVELDAELAQLARQNLARQPALRTRYEIRNQNALDVDFDEATAVVLIDPFGADTMQSMLERLKASVERRPRPVRIAFFMAVAPRSLEVLAASGWLTSGPTIDMSVYGLFEQCELSMWYSTLPVQAGSRAG